jgi:hypothetical protein
MTDDNLTMMSRDLGNQIPTAEDFGEKQPMYGDEENISDTGALSGYGTPIVDTGPSYFTQQAVTVQLSGINTGR